MMTMRLKRVSCAGGETDVRQRRVQVDPVGERVGDGRALLVDLLEHERLIAALLDNVVVPVDARRGDGQALARRAEEAHVLGAEHRDLTFLEHADLAGVIEECRDRRRDELLVLADADDQRALAAGADKQVGVVCAHRDEGEVAVELSQRGLHGGDEVAVI